METPLKIRTHSYRLSPKTAPNAKSTVAEREGRLLKVWWTPSLIGYGDLFPWPEFGDPSLMDLLSQLAEGDFSHPLVFKSLWRSRVDALARRRGRSLFEALLPVESHGLLPSGEETRALPFFRQQGFRVFKIKMPAATQGNPERLIFSLREAGALLQPGEKLRLDFNGALSFEEFQKFSREIPASVWERVDLMEDPWERRDLQSDLQKNSSFSREFPLPSFLQNKLAGDFFSDAHWPHQVIKTARAFAPEKRHLSHRVVQTHSMDHPLGQAFALWEASLYERTYPHRKEIHGVSRPSLYASTDFDWAWEGAGPRPRPPRGTGIGFDEILSSLRWENL